MEVYHLRSIAQASQVLGITQSAASRRISDLETVLGQPLFERQGRRLVPNGPARLLLHYAEGALLRLNRGLDLVMDASSTAGHAIAIGALPTVAATLIPRVILAMRDTAPGILLRVETGAGNQLLPDLRAGRLDVLVGRMAPPAQLQGLRFEPLFQDRLAVVTRADHPLAGMKPALSELTRFPMILPPPDAVIRPIVDAFLMARSIGISANRIETTAATVATALLVQSDAIWVISRGVAEAAVLGGPLAFLQIDTADTIGAIGVTRREEEAATDPQIDLLVEMLRQQTSDGTSGPD